MIVRSPRPANHFVMIRNEVIRDSRLSFKARGLLAYLLSFPDNWRVSAQILARSGPDGYTSVLSGMRELKSAGYLRTVKEKDSAGRFTSTTYVFDEPESPRNGAELDDIPGSDSPSSGDPLSEIPSAIEDFPHEERSKKTVNACAQDMARQYSEVVPLSNFPAVMGVVKKALMAGYSADTVRPALMRLADSGRPVTADTLRVEIEGLPPIRPSRRIKTLDEYAALTEWAREQDERNEGPRAIGQ